jgi:hypothetical protein
MRRSIYAAGLLTMTSTFLILDARGQVFVGSTPCEDLTRHQLKIPDGVPCEFVKWEVRLESATPQKGSFSFVAEYGESKPNTNGFKVPTKIQASGTYSVAKGKNSQWYYYQLVSEEIGGEIPLIRMDDNIFHFGRNDGGFLTGNGGFGYVLNREPRITKK